jgi:hypothetical protein
MNHNTANITTSSSPSLSTFTASLGRLSGVIALILGLLLFMLWFGHSMNAYLGNLSSGGGSPHITNATELVVSAR